MKLYMVWTEGHVMLYEPDGNGMVFGWPGKAWRGIRYYLGRHGMINVMA